MGFASGLNAGSAMASRLVGIYNDNKDRQDKANRQKKVDDLTAQLEQDQVETGFQAPTAQFGVTDGPAPRMAGLSLGQQAPTGDVTVGDMSGAPTATGLDVNAPLAKGSRKRSRAETEGLLGQIALAKGDHAGYAGSLDRVRIAEMSQLDDEVAKTSLSDIEGLLKQTNTNQSNLPVLYTGKDKNGYEVTLLGDGSEPGGKFKLNEAQLRGLYRAQKLAEAGYGAESMAAMTGAHKEIGEHIARYNGLVSQNVQGSNTAMRYGNQDKHNTDTLAENVRNNKVREGLSRQQLASQERDRKDNANYRAQQTQLARLGATRYERGQDGNTYALTPTMTPQGLKFERQMVNPDGIQFQKPFDPKEYASTVASLAEANGGNIKQARIEADQLYGRGPGTQLENPALRARDAQVAEDTKNPSQARGRQVSPALAPRPVNLAPVGRSEVAPSAPQAAPGGAQLLSRVNDGRYNVRMPDGTTALVTEDVALQMGLVEPPQPRRGFQLPSNVQNNFLTYGGMPGYDY